MAPGSPPGDMEKAALRGEPSYVWRAGQERRLQMILGAAGSLAQGCVLDSGCGLGIYLEHLAPLARRAVGVEYDRQRARQAAGRRLHVAQAAAENLPFASSCFDLVLSHEVLEHVAQDRAAIEEMARVLRPPSPPSNQGGRLVLFVPNRGYPFETHGVFWRSRYRFGNIPLVNYLPRRLRNRLAPHVRIFSRRDLERLFDGLPLRLLHHGRIFGGYDNLIARWPRLGPALRRLLQSLERTPLNVFGLSHFCVFERC